MCKKAFICLDMQLILTMHALQLSTVDDRYVSRFIKMPFRETHKNTELICTTSNDEMLLFWAKLIKVENEATHRKVYDS